MRGDTQGCVGTLTRPCPAGALISHDKLLLQLNPERELGDMSYKLGQVSASRWPAGPVPPHPTLSVTSWLSSVCVGGFVK